MKTHWSDGYQNAQVGDTGFLLMFHNINKSDSPREFELRGRPGSTNLGGVLRLSGDLGTTNNIYVHALGLAEVIRVTRNGRILLREITDRSRMIAVLDDLGYPDLLD